MTASRRVQILRVLRDTVDAVLDGGCVMPRRRGLDFTHVPCAVVYAQGDVLATQTTRTDGGPGIGGTDLRTLTVVVDVFLFDPDAEPVDVDNPGAEDLSTMERVDEQLVLVETAIKALGIESPAGTLATQWRDLADEWTAPEVGMRTTEDGQRLVGGHLTFTINYRNAERDPTEAP